MKHLVEAEMPIDGSAASHGDICQIFFLLKWSGRSQQAQTRHFHQQPIINNVDEFVHNAKTKTNKLPHGLMLCVTQARRLFSPFCILNPSWLFFTPAICFSESASLFSTRASIQRWYQARCSFPQESWRHRLCFSNYPVFLFHQQTATGVKRLIYHLGIYLPKLR